MNGEAGQRWDTTTLGEACEINPPKPKLPGFPDDTPVMFVPMASVDDVAGVIATPEERTLEEVRSKPYRTFGPQDVIFAKITPCMENGKCAVVPDILSGLGFGSTEFHVLRPQPGVNPRFIWHYVRQERFRRLAEDHMTGSVGQLRVPVAFLRDFPLQLPPSAVQDEIVRALDISSTKGQSAVQHLSAARRAIERFRQAVLAAACSGRLTADWREQNDVSSAVGRLPGILESHRRQWHAMTGARASSRVKYKEPRTASAHDLQLPSTWTVASLSQLAHLMVGNAFKSKEFSNHGIRLLRGENSAPGRLKWLDVKYWPEEKLDGFAHLLVQEDDLILGMDRPIISSGLKLAKARPEDIPSLLVQRVLRIRTVEPELTHLIELCLRDGRFEAYLSHDGMTGTDLPHITGTGVAEFPIPLPPLEEQREIVRLTGTLLDFVSRLEGRINAVLKQLERSSQAVLAKAFRGELIQAVEEEESREPAAEELRT